MPVRVHAFKGDAVLLDSLPHDRFTDAIVLRDLAHRHPLVEIAQLIRGRIEPAPSPGRFHIFSLRLERRWHYFATARTRLTPRASDALRSRA